MKRAERTRKLGWLLTRLPHAVTACLVLALYLTGSLAVVDNKLTDLGFQTAQRSASGGIVLVEIDAKSIAALETWPWPRGFHAQVLDKLVAAGAEQVAFDVDFSARSSKEQDELLEAALRRAAGKIVLPVFSQHTRSDDGTQELKRSAPLPEFRQHGLLASVNVRPDPDGLIRAMATHDGNLPSLAALLADDHHVSYGAFQIDYGIQAETIPRLSFVDVLNGTFDPAAVTGKLVVIGSTAVELGDQLAVPVHKTKPGPVIHILAAESLIQGRALIGVAIGPIGAGVLLLSIFLGPLFLRWKWQWSLVALIAAIAGLVGVAIGLQSVTPVLVDVGAMILAVILSFGVAVIKRIDQQALRLIFQNIDLRRKDEMMRNVVENSFDGIITADSAGIIQSANPAASQIFSGSEAHLVGQALQDFFPDLTGIADTEGLSIALHAGGEPHELTGRRLNGRTIPVELSASFLQEEDQNLFTLFFRDITDRKRQRERLVHQANHDALTGLPNRKLFYERLDREVQEAGSENREFAVLLLDLDRFKEVNDTLGHPTGDKLLIKIAEGLQAIVPASDTIARVGGDEFALLLPSADTVAKATAFAQELLKLVCEPFDLAGLRLEVAGSVGIAMYPEHGEEGALLVQRADVAMYVAKRDQTGVSVYDEEKDQNSVRFLTLTGDLRRAIQEGQLALFYQPKICLKEFRITAVEALIRWIHPEHGFIPPDDFIDKAEQTGVIGEMTEWVVNTAIEQAAAWRKKGVEIDVAVNISARMLGDFGIVDIVSQCLEKWRVPAQSVILEVTENALMDDPSRAMEVITALSDLGARISIDDFGTGYSSLGYLKDFPANELKIDRCFVQTLDEDKGNESIVWSTLGLAHSLGLKVVAEGIENEAVMALLAEINCDVGQGYFFSKPLPIAEFDEWLATSRWGISSASGDGSRQEAPALSLA